MKHYKDITSAENNQYKQIKKLAHSARERRKQKTTLLDGMHLLHALADTNGSLELVILRQNYEDEIEIQSCLKRFASTPGIVLSATLFDKVSPVETPTGILAIYKMHVTKPITNDCAVLLENIQDPGNLGAIFRTAVAAGVDAVYLSKGCTEAWSPKVLRAAMGAHFSLAIKEQQNLSQICLDFPLSIATQLDVSTSLYDLDLSDRVAFLFGNEGNGLSTSLSAQATHKIRIPMRGKIESLNVAAATAICLFERVRQKENQENIY
ncbi:rRNA methylases [hydrothermal vent metagenome]|uniref:rRNA methylases n=1 Tax=hydrothermal vent metagenome TaxID=652676 RepID=A0A3B0YTL4_9ZZZZ